MIRWLTGFDDSAVEGHLAAGTTFEDFFADAHLNPNASLITGTVCGVRVENVDDPLMQKIRYLDKLVDELAKGRSMAEDPAGVDDPAVRGWHLPGTPLGRSHRTRPGTHPSYAHSSRRPSRVTG